MAGKYRLWLWLLAPLYLLPGLWSGAGADPPMPPSKGKKVALLIGVNDYQHRKLDPLKYAAADVTDLERVLKAAGFEVRVVRGSDGIDAKTTGKDVYFAALADSLKGVGRSDTVLLGFSGHGVQLFVKAPGPGGQVVEKEVPFFCPSDAVPSESATLISLNDVLKILDEKGGGHNLLLVDACRNVVDPNRGARGGIDSGRIENLGPGTAVFMACSSRQRARETDKAGGGHGVFFHFVIEGLKGEAGNAEGEVTWEQLIPYVKRRVRDEFPKWFDGLPEDERQQPHVIANLTDDPVLVAGIRRSVTTPPTPLNPPVTEAAIRTARTAWAKYLGRSVEEKVDLGGGVGMEFVLVPPGEFQMGSPPTEVGRDEDETGHSVTITQPYYLGKYEVTQAQYVRLAGTNPSFFGSADDHRSPGSPVPATLPVDRVSWEDAAKFCKRLSTLPTGMAAGRDFRLPSEAEWEYACRECGLAAGPFHFGDSLEATQVNFDGGRPYGNGRQGMNRGRTLPVGSFQPNRLGLYDLHGNVAEWCADWYGEYAAERSTNPTGPMSGEKRVVRGGSFEGSAESCRSAFRLGAVSKEGYRDQGFRVAYIARKVE